MCVCVCVWLFGGECVAVGSREHVSDQLWLCLFIDDLDDSGFLFSFTHQRRWISVTSPSNTRGHPSSGRSWVCGKLSWWSL